jgi:hypothetical protein
VVNLKIESVDKQSWLTIEYVESETGHYPGLGVSIAVQNDGFSGCNPEVWFELDFFKRFLDELRIVAQKKSGNALVESMTAEEFKLKIQSTDINGPLMLQYKLSKNIYHPKRVNISICGSFELDAGDFPERVKEFEKLIPEGEYKLR